MNDVHPTIPIWRTVVTAYRHGVGALFRDGALFRYFIYASLLSLVIFGLHIYRTGLRLSPARDESTPAEWIGSIVVGMLLYLGYAAAISPFAVAMHRKFLLGETPREFYLGAVIKRGQARFLLATIAVYGIFFVAAFASHPVIFLVYGLSLFDAAAVTRAYAAQPTIALVVSVLTWMSYAAAALIATRFTFAFPAIATEASGASLRRSFADTRGSTWRLSFIFILIFALPFVSFMIASGIASFIFVANHPELAQSPDALATTMMYSPPFLTIYAAMFVIMMVMVSVTAVAAAQAYEIRVNRGLSGVAEVFT